MQKDKKAIAEAALGDGNSAAAAPARLSLEELRKLFGLGRGSAGSRRHEVGELAEPTRHPEELMAEAGGLLF